MALPVPTYPATRPLDISDRALLEKHFRVLQPAVSELTFANLFLFRHVHRYSLASVNNSLVICGCGYDGAPYFLPPVSGDVEAATRQLLAGGGVLYGADEAFIARYLGGSDFSIISDRDNDDYLFLRSELAELPGKRFHKKKNRINYFTSRHTYNVEPYSGKYLVSALDLLRNWQKVHDDDRSCSLAAETAATREGLESAAELGLSGVVVLTGGNVAAFALGEQLNATTVVCHFEKGDPFLEGVTQLVNREFSRRQAADIIYINREQDLGESGLRGAKNSYHPAVMVKKFRVKRLA